MKGTVYIAVVLLLLVSCNTKQPKAEQPHCVPEATLPVKYAKGFRITYYNGFKLITVNDLKDSTVVLARYVMLPKGKPAPVDFKDAVLLDTTTRRIVCISTNHIAEMASLGIEDSIAGVANPELVNSESVLAGIRAGTITDVGSNELNYEKIMALQPSFVFTYGIYDGGDKLQAKLANMHITAVLNMDYREQEPLARAEWIKFVAAFYNREAEADSIFKGIEERYLSLKHLADSAESKPTVFCNLPFKDIWYMPCGENYMAKLLADAGADFLWKDASASNGLNLSLDYEAVFAKASGADFWVNTNFCKSLQEIKELDRKNIFFKAYKTGMVYNNDKRNTEANGFDFWESGVVNPDKILADLIYIFHPKLLPQHQLYYYRQLK
ncbi:MAG: ABC transporter substrate-binding protein [Chitinophagales bacterium]